MGIYYTYPVLGDYPTKKVKQTIEFHLHIAIQRL